MGKDLEEIKYLVFDIESIPDSKLIKSVKYPGEDISEQEAVEKLRAKLLEASGGQSDFIPVTFQLPVSVCIAQIREDFSFAGMISLDEGEFRPLEMAKLFWDMVENRYKNASMVTFNGRGFDVPLMELMAYRFGLTVKRHFKDKWAGRYRFGTKHIDLQDWISNFSAIRVNGGLNMLAKLLGKPGKMSTKGDDVYGLYLQGKMEQINNYCMHDVLDTYFVFLRTRVLLGEISPEQERELSLQTLKKLEEEQEAIPAFAEYIAHCKN